jgi:hypothetical protein
MICIFFLLLVPGAYLEWELLSVMCDHLQTALHGCILEECTKLPPSELLVYVLECKQPPFFCIHWWQCDIVFFI